MKDFKQKLLSLLNKCADDQNDAAKLQYLASIMRSDDYREIENNASILQEHSDTFSVASLEKLTAPELKKRQKEIKALANMFRLLHRAILFGNAPALNADDKPTFDDLQSVSRLSDKIKVSDDRKNFSNITSDCIMKVFDEGTIKSAKECFDLLPLSMAKSSFISEEDLKSALGDKLFCVDAAKLSAIHSNFMGYSSKAEDMIAKEKLRRKKHRLFKVAVVMLMFLVSFACEQFGLFAPQYSALFTILVLVISIVFLIWG